MSRRSMMPQQRNLTLTEELEKLEQSITLTLQEIDHNFSKAHRIVTGSILPIVEQYAKHSDSVWEGSKFWKQFFEASANVSLSGYEEAAEDGDETVDLTEATAGHDDDATYGTPSTRAGDGEGDTILTSTDATTPERPHSRLGDNEDKDELDLTALDDTPVAKTQATPKRTKPAFADYASPYESLKQNLTRNPTTPGPSNGNTTKHARSPVLPSAKRTQDPLLHRVLDKTYRVHATPHTARKEKPPPTHHHNPALDSSPLSSPPMAAPQLRSEFFSPRRTAAPRTPGVSIHATTMTAKGKTPITTASSARKTLFPSASKPQTQTPNANPAWLDEDEEEDWTLNSSDPTNAFGMSPPKTLQFVVPTSRLMQTPAREASRRIVEDLLATAGAGVDETDTLSELRLEGRYEDYDVADDGHGVDDDGIGSIGGESPSIVRARPGGLLDDDEF